VIRYSLFKAH